MHIGGLLALLVIAALFVSGCARPSYPNADSESKSTNIQLSSTNGTASFQSLVITTSKAVDLSVHQRFWTHSREPAISLLRMQSPNGTRQVLGGYAMGSFIEAARIQGADKELTIPNPLARRAPFDESAYMNATIAPGKWQFILFSGGPINTTIDFSWRISPHTVSEIASGPARFLHMSEPGMGVVSATMGATVVSKKYPEVNVGESSEAIMSLTLFRGYAKYCFSGVEGGPKCTEIVAPNRVESAMRFIPDLRGRSISLDFQLVSETSSTAFVGLMAPNAASLPRR